MQLTSNERKVLQVAWPLSRKAQRGVPWWQLRRGTQITRTSFGGVLGSLAKKQLLWSVRGGRRAVDVAFVLCAGADALGYHISRCVGCSQCTAKRPR